MIIIYKNSFDTIFYEINNYHNTIKFIYNYSKYI
jgi:hypothetical protein